jgi:hypothetical protein
MSSSSGFGTGSFGSSALGSQPFFNVSTLIDSVLYATGHQTPSIETTKRRALLQFVNNRYQEICMGTHWRWLKAAYDFNLEAPYTTGTVSATIGDATIAGVSTAWSTTNVQPKNVLFFDGLSQVYHVASRTSSTELELETEFAGDDNLSGESYTIAQNQYELPSTTDHLISFIVDSTHKMAPVGVQDFRRIQAMNPTRTGMPMYYALVRRDTDDDSVYVEVWPTPDKAYQCHIDYIVRIMYLEDSTDCYPIIPDRYRSVLYYGVLAEFYSFLRDPSGHQLAEGQYRAFLNQMRNDTQQTDDRMVIVNERNYRNRIPSVRRFKGTTTIEDFGREG